MGRDPYPSSAMKEREYAHPLERTLLIARNKYVEAPPFRQYPMSELLSVV
jgi:hypothetical protein